MGATEKLTRMLWAAVGLLVGFVAIAVYEVVHRPPVKPTVHIFMDNSMFCCQPVANDATLVCKDGELIIRNASNFIDTKKECAQ